MKTIPELTELIKTTIERLNSEINNPKLKLKIRVDGLDYGEFKEEEKPISFSNSKNEIIYFKSETVGDIDFYSEMKTKKLDFN